MRLRTLHKVITYLLVLSAVSALLFSPELSPLLCGMVLAAIAASWFVEQVPPRAGRYTALWNVATVLLLLYLVLDAWRGASVLTAGAHFLLFVLINKLFNRQRSKDYQQLYVISFLILVLGTTLNTGLSYAVAFAAFVLLSSWALVLLHLRRRIEEQQARQEAPASLLDSPHLVSRAFLAGTFLVSLCALLGATLIFGLFPRIGFGLFLGQQRPGVALVGFGEEVQLGYQGGIRDNPQVVMRVVFSDGKSRGGLRWRGAAYDHYEAGAWSHGPEVRTRPRAVSPRDGLYILNYAPGLLHLRAPALIRERLLRQEIYLEPLDSSVLFAADRPVALEVAHPVIGARPFFIPRRGALDELRADEMRSAGVRYVAYSQVGLLTAAQLRQSPPFRDPTYAPFLQLPAGLPARIGALARQIARGQTTVYDQVVAVERYLRSHYRYTLKLTHDPQQEPVDEFLFTTRRGHCEYFASAMALLLRHLGIHTRQVNGFAGGEWNRVGSYLAVRQRDAHAWVEVLFAGIGWVTFDPTPAGQGQRQAALGWSSRLGQLWDALRLRWFRYVIEYDLGKQITALRRLQRLFTPRRAALHARSARPGEALGIALLVATLAILIFWWVRGRRRTHRRAAPGGLSVASAFYVRALHQLARAGYRKAPGVTPREFVEELTRETGLGVGRVVDSLTCSYYDLRYGGAALTGERAHELTVLLHELKQALAQHGPRKREY